MQHSASLSFLDSCRPLDAAIFFGFFNMYTTRCSYCNRLNHPSILSAIQVPWSPHISTEATIQARTFASRAPFFTPVLVTHKKFLCNENPPQLHKHHSNARLVKQGPNAVRGGGPGWFKYVLFSHPNRFSLSSSATVFLNLQQSFFFDIVPHHAGFLWPIFFYLHLHLFSWILTSHA
jgi:hypothetical protein